MDKLVYQRNAVLSLPIYGYISLLVFILFNHSICILESCLACSNYWGYKAILRPSNKATKSIYMCCLSLLCHANAFAEFCYRSFALIMHI